MAAAACWILSVNNANNQVFIAEAGAIPPLVELLKNGSAEAMTNAVAALETLALHEDNRDLIVEAGAIRPLVELLKNGSAEAKTEAARALKRLAFHAKNQVLIAEAGAIPPLVKLRTNGSAKAKTKAAGALKKLAHNANNKDLIDYAHYRERGLVPVVYDTGSDGVCVPMASDVRFPVFSALTCVGARGPFKATSNGLRLSRFSFSPCSYICDW